MRKYTLGRVLLVFAVLCGEALIIADQAYADCCMCYQRCSSGCTCPGTSLNCPKCFGPDNIINNASREVVPAAMIINSDSIDRFIRLAGSRQCPQNNSRLNLIETRAMLRFDPAFVNNNRIQGNVVAQQVTIGEEK